jgi:uncharacterized delta-60 repeat protein
MVGMEAHASSSVTPSLARLTSHGRLDRDFGNRGQAPLDIRVAPAWAVGAHPMAATLDGGFLVAGYSYISQLNFAVARYQGNGELVTSFGDGGVARDTFTGSLGSSSATAVATDGAGRFLVAGDAGDQFGIARLLPDGTLDGSFSSDGRLTMAPIQDSAGWPTVTTVSNVFALGSGGVLLVGSERTGEHGGCASIISGRVTEGGAVDATYGTDGVKRTNQDCAGVAAGLLGPGDGLTIAGSIFDYFNPERYEYRVLGPTGTVSSGTLSEPLGGQLSDAALLRDGDILLAGTAIADHCAVGVAEDGAPCQAAVLKRLDSEGATATDFGDHGIVSYPAMTPGLARNEFRTLVAESMPESVRAHKDKVGVLLRCLAEARTGCVFHLVLRARRGASVELKHLDLEAGASKRVSANLGDTELGDHANLRGEVSSPGQDPVQVNSRVEVRR